MPKKFQKIFWKQKCHTFDWMQFSNIHFTPLNFSTWKLFRCITCRESLSHSLTLSLSIWPVAKAINSQLNNDHSLKGLSTYSVVQSNCVAPKTKWAKSSLTVYSTLVYRLYTESTRGGKRDARWERITRDLKIKHGNSTNNYSKIWAYTPWRLSTHFVGDFTWFIACEAVKALFFFQHEYICGKQRSETSAKFNNGRELSVAEWSMIW